MTLVIISIMLTSMVASVAVARMTARRNAPGCALDASLAAVSAVVMRLRTVSLPVGKE